VRERLARLGPNVAVALALGMLAYRFRELGLSPFILDEPAFLTAAREQLQTGRWASLSPIAGSQGVRYGPSVVWFYGVVQAVAGPDPRASILAMCLLVTLAQLVLAWSVARAFGGGRLLFAVLLAFIAASPFQFFWARLAWDPLANVAACLTVALLASRERFGAGKAVALGLVLGIGLSSHPMIVPLVVAVAVLLVVDLRRTPRRLFGWGGLTAGAMLLVNVPYLLHLLREPQRGGSAPGFTWAALGDFLRATGQVSTSWGTRYFFDDQWDVFLAWLGPLRAVLQPSPVLLWIVLGVAVPGFLAGIRAGGAHRRLAVFATGTWLGYALFYAYAVENLGRQPHYEFPVWWVVPVGVAGALAWARRRSAAWGGTAVAVVLATSVLHFAFIAAWMAFVKAQGGIRGIHYSTPIALQQQAVRTACAEPERELLLRNETLIFPEALRYLATVEPACAGKQVAICSHEGCPAAEPGAKVLTLVYARETGGAVGWR